MTFQRWVILGSLAVLAIGIFTCLGLSVCFLLVPDLPATPGPVTGPTSFPLPTAIPVPTPPQFNFIDARTMCAGFVEDRLKSPSTANFLLETEEAYGATKDGVNMPRNNHLVKGQVDAQNSFGATVRMTYLCQLHYDPENPDQWYLDKIHVGE